MSTPVPGSPEHEAAMIALAERSGVRIRSGNATSGTLANVTTEAAAETPAEAPATAPAEKPADERGMILGKFKSTEDLIAAYQALEQKQSAAAKPAVADPTKPAEKPAEVLKEEPKADEKKEEVPAPSVSDVRNKATEELQKDGKLSDETYANAAKLGWDKATVDEYVEGIKARGELAKMRADVITTKVHAEVGGADNFAALNQWAAANWTAEQINAHNASVTSGDANKVLAAVKSLKEAHTVANGRAPEARVERQGGSNATTPTDRFRSKEEAQAAFTDPRYVKGDRAVHAEVDRKLAASMKAGPPGVGST